MITVNTTAYVCDYCGYSSVVKDRVLRCEARHLKASGIKEQAWDRTGSFPRRITVEFEGGRRAAYEFVQEDKRK